MRKPLIVLAFGLFFLAWPAPSAEAGTPKVFHETTIVQDAVGDFETEGLGALDIEAIHLSERYFFNPDTDERRATAYFRVQVRALGEIENFKGKTPIEYEIHFKLAGQDVVINATVIQDCPVGLSGVECTDPTTARPNYLDENAGVTLVVAAESAGFAPGAQITEIYAASSQIVNGEKMYYDVAPENSSGTAPSSELAPTQTSGPYTFQGTYPFIRAELLTPALRYAVPGGEASFVVNFVTDNNLTGSDTIRIFYDVPAGWTVKSTIEPPVVPLTAASSDVEFEMQPKASAIAKVGDKVPITMEAILVTAGGRTVLPVEVEITDPKTPYPEFEFQLVEEGPFQSGADETLSFKIMKDGEPLLPSLVKVDFVMDDEVETTKTAKERDGERGTYDVTYSFPEGGTWTVDVYIAEIVPSPHQPFDVEVESDEGFLPGFELVAALAAVGLLLWRRR